MKYNNFELLCIAPTLSIYPKQQILNDNSESITRLFFFRKINKSTIYFQSLNVFKQNSLKIQILVTFIKLNTAPWAHTHTTYNKTTSLQA